MICESTGQKEFAGNFAADVDLLTLQLAKFSNVTITDYCESSLVIYALTAPLCRIAVNIMHESYLLGQVKIIPTIKPY